jgi:hypothetical protein
VGGVASIIVSSDKVLGIHAPTVEHGSTRGCYSLSWVDAFILDDAGGYPDGVGSQGLVRPLDTDHEMWMDARLTHRVWRRP